MTDSSPDAIAAGFALALLVGLPVLAALDARRSVELEAAAEHRRALYLSVALSLLFIAAITLGVVIWRDIPGRAVGWVVEDTMSAFGWGVGTAAVGFVVLWAATAAARAAGLEESPIARLMMPRDGAEKGAFLLLSGVAAACEEFVFRGFLLWALTGWTGAPWFAAAVVSLSFGLAHGYQKLAGVLRAATLGMLLAAPTILTGSLFPAIVAHFWINAAVGLGGWRYLLPEADE